MARDSWDRRKSAAADRRRPQKKKVSILVSEGVDWIDYKDVNLLQKFMTDRSKIRGQKLAGVSVQEQRDIANAIKNAREMALLPYTKRTVSTRAPRAGSDRREEEGNLELEDAGIPSDFVPADDADETTVDTATEEVEA